ASSFLCISDDPRPGLKALYVHIPFCDTICTFCPFAKSVGTPERVTAYLRALHTEMQVLGGTERIGGWELDSVYIGGGTPSVLAAWQDRLRSGEPPRPAALAERSAMFHAARGQLLEHMAEQNMYCFGSVDAPPTRYMFSTLYGGYRDECVGVGSGAYSFIRGLAYYNEADERTYVKRATSGELPIVCSSPGHAYEKGMVFFPKRL